jgi:cyclopropane fatty-acyl-phospholipid synthase-like methyltransferase
MQRENALAYSKGNDFFEAFLGPSMVYTSGIHDGLDQTLEQAQENKCVAVGVIVVVSFS